MSLPSLPLPSQSIKNSKQKIAEVIQSHAPQEIIFKAARESARRQNQPVRVILPVDGPTYHAFKGSVPSPMNPRLDVFMINAPAEIKKPGKHKPSIGQALADVGLQPVLTNGGGGAICLVPNDKNGAALYAKALFQAVAQPLFGLDRSLIPRGASAEFIQGLGDAYRGQTALNVLFGVNQGVSVMGGLGGPAAKFVAGRNIRKLPWDGRQKIDPKTATMNVKVISKEIIPKTLSKTSSKIVKTPKNSKKIIPKTPSKKRDGFLKRSTPLDKHGNPISPEEYFKVSTFKEMQMEFSGRYSPKFLPDFSENGKRKVEFLLHDAIVHLYEPNENKDFIHRINGRLIEFVFGGIFAPTNFMHGQATSYIEDYYQKIDIQVEKTLKNRQLLSDFNQAIDHHYNIQPTQKNFIPQSIQPPLRDELEDLFKIESAQAPPSGYRPRPLSAEDLLWMYQFYRGEIKRIAQLNQMTDAELIKYMKEQPFDKVAQLKISRPPSVPRWGSTEPPAKY